jgi:hypothetical protein
MIDVLIPVPANAREDGVAYADTPSTSEYEGLPDEGLLHDCPVRVVPAGALQALLKKSPTFAAYEKRFGQVSDRDKASIIALFALVEEERTLDQDKRNSARQEFETWTLIKRRNERKEARTKSSPEEEEKMAQYLADHDMACHKKRERPHTITNQLNGWTLRVWRDERTDPDTLSPGVLAGDFVGALHVLLLLNLARPESVAECGRCKKRFSRTKTTQHFCSLRCGNNARQARQRIRNEAKKKGKL